jgi:predicted secreted protein
MLTSEASTQRRELLRTKRELEELGCSLLRRSPVTIHIPGTEDGEDRTVIWRLRETKKGENEVEEIYIATQAARGR